MYDTTAEEWRDIIGYEGLYKISSHGRVKSYHARYKKPRILKTSMTTTGYRKVELAKNKIKKSRKIHRLVAEAFIPNKENKPYVNHLDSNPLNNNVNNSFAWKNKEQVISEYISGKSIKYLAKKYSGTNCTTIIEVLKREKIKRRTYTEQRMKYKYSRKEMVSMFENGLRNVDISRILGIPTALVGTYKYKWKKGEKLC